MVRIFNIFKDDEKICCNYEPEKSGKIGYIELSADASQVLKVDYSEYPYALKTYVTQVRSKISEALKNSESLPEKMYSVWY